AETYPKARACLASGRVVHEAGGSEGWELGFALASALAYARALAGAGLSPEDAFARISLGLSADAEYFTAIAKLRAGRLLWAKLTAACEVSAPAMLEVRSSRRMLARLDAWTNLLRLTAAGFGAAAGGAEVVTLDPFTTPYHSGDRRASALARRQARNIQLVLMEEAGLGRVADPAGGSGHIEALTEGLARAGWAAFQAIERAGGAAEALKEGVVAEAVAFAREARAQAYLDDARGLIGVTRFPNKHDEPPATETVDPDLFARTAPDFGLPGPDDRCPPLQPVRWAQPFEGDAE
ncbi:MAG: methylmalonyl-CoA mutase family protein, partial [Pseudomonadota bacterium]|nr:methylmalonyl-CoA mutase family protein [Pseudomonadota bacterium]